MAQTPERGSELKVTRGKRIGLGVLGLIIVALFAGPPEFDAALVFNGFGSELDGGAHQFHFIMRGVGAVVYTALGIILVIRPQWALGVAQVAAVTGVAYPIGGLLGLFFWPPVAVYPIVGLIVAGTIYAMFRHQMKGANSVTRAVPSRMLLIATAVIAVPLMGFALSEASLQRGPEFVHGDLGHWAGGTAMAVKIILMGLMASLKWPGWRVPAYSAAFSLLMFGAVSIAMPNQASSIGEIWGALAVLGGVAFIAVAEMEGRLYTGPAVQPASS